MVCLDINARRLWCIYYQEIGFYIDSSLSQAFSISPSPKMDLMMNLVAQHGDERNFWGVFLGEFVS